MVLVVILTVLEAKADDFRAFERAAARVMAAYGGAIERAIVVPPEPGVDTFREVHIVTFPDAEAFAAYRADPRMAEVRHLRESSVVNTVLMEGEHGPDYMGSPDESVTIRGDET